MKAVETIRVASLAILIAVIMTGCVSKRFAQIDEPIIIGDKEYVALLTERVQPWGTSAVSLNLVESELEQNAPPMITQQVQCQQVQNVQCQQVPSVFTKTHIANSNNQGSTGWASGAFQGAVGGVATGTGIAAAGALMRPSKVTTNGGGASSSAAAASSP